jgi:hypothetical protein
MVHPAVLVNGRIVGIWKSKREKNHLKVNVDPFEPLMSEVLAGIETEVADIARFLGVPAILHMTHHMP